MTIIANLEKKNSNMLWFGLFHFLSLNITFLFLQYIESNVHTYTQHTQYSTDSLIVIECPIFVHVINGSFILHLEKF